MKDSRFPYLIPVFAAIALLVSSLMVYAGFLTAAWGTLLACAPAVLATIGIVGGMVSGMLFFEAEEGETPEEASRMDGALLFDWLGARIAGLAHRAALGLHLRGLRH